PDEPYDRRPMAGAGRRRALLLAAAACAGCGGDRITPTAPRSVALTLRLETAHFRLYTEAAPDVVLREVASALEAALPRYQADLDVDATRPFTVRVWQDETAWSAAVQRHFGRPIDTTGYVTGPEEIRVLAGSRVVRNATHELAHCVSL